MSQTAYSYVEIDPTNQDMYIFRTDFEYISYTSEEYSNSCFYLDAEDIVYIRFIYSPILNKHFSYCLSKQANLDKFFFLPTHKTREFRSTINESLTKSNFSKELEEYYTIEMIKEFEPESYYLNSDLEIKIPEERKDCSTSLFILFEKERFEKNNEVTLKSILRFSDLEGKNDEERKNIILRAGLDVCTQIPLYKYLVSFGRILPYQGILEWDKTLRTDTPEPGSSHVHFFKLNKEKNNVCFQKIANQFTLTDNKMNVKPPKRRKSSRRKVHSNKL